MNQRKKTVRNPNCISLKKNQRLKGGKKVLPEGIEKGVACEMEKGVRGEF